MNTPNISPPHFEWLQSWRSKLHDLVRRIEELLAGPYEGPYDIGPVSRGGGEEPTPPPPLTLHMSPRKPLTGETPLTEDKTDGDGKPAEEDESIEPPEPLPEDNRRRQSDRRVYDRRKVKFLFTNTDAKRMLAIIINKGEGAAVIIPGDSATIELDRDSVIEVKSIDPDNSDEIWSDLLQQTGLWIALKRNLQ